MAGPFVRVLLIGCLQGDPNPGARPETGLCGAAESGESEGGVQGVRGTTGEDQSPRQTRPRAADGYRVTGRPLILLVYITV